MRNNTVQCGTPTRYTRAQTHSKANTTRLLTHHNLTVMVCRVLVSVVRCLGVGGGVATDATYGVGKEVTYGVGR